MNKIPNREIINNVLMEKAAQNKDIIVLASDSRGSAKLSPFADTNPNQFVEVGIAEQNIVSIAAGLASCGKTAFVVSPACFLSMRSIEQIKVDVAYSNTNVKLIGISGGISYGALGMSHHSVQDIAVMRAIPNMTIIIPSDRFETQRVLEEVLITNKPTYIRVGRNPVEDVYKSLDYSFEIGKANILHDGEDVTIIACGETVRIALDAALLLKNEKISARVINMHTIKPLDKEIIVKAAKETKLIITVEEHSIFGGLGGAVAEIVVQNTFVPMKIIGILDEPAVAGTTSEVFNHYGITAKAIFDFVLSLSIK
ncbi:MAG: transketolase family protein [Bacteroidales bacterium]|nr:transketolase family protein [Bacteroidales bacterium]